jgi:uncharacterized protein YpuA (DUF1002 family)
MVEKIKAIEDALAYDYRDGRGHELRVAAIAAALAEAEMMNERAEQAGAEWKRAGEAWRKIDSQLSRGGSDDPGDILDQFFGGGEGEG